MKPQPLKNIIEEVLKSLEKKSNSIEVKILRAWEENIDTQQKTQVIDFKKGVLIIKVYNPILLFKFNLQKNQIKEKINIVIGEEKIKDIRFMV